MYCRDETVELTREELYKQVWRKSAVQLAKDFGISDVAIAKLCKKHNIPKPPTGYWARVENGQKLSRPPLPKVHDEKLKVVQFRRSSLPESRSPQNPETIALLEEEKDEAHRIIVADQLLSPHPLVERTHKSISNAGGNDWGIVRPKAKQCLDVAVSKANIDRSMRIMDALLKAVEARGFEVTVTDKENDRSTQVKVLGETLKIRLEEILDGKQREPTPEEIKRQAEWSYYRIPIRYDYTPSGRLKLGVPDGRYANLRRNWSDTANRRLEDRLNAVIIGLLKIAEFVKAERIEWERQKQAWAAAQQRAEEEARRIAEEKRRVEDLDAKAAVWHKSENLRTYLAAVERAAIQKNGRIDPETDLGKWLSWARRHAESLDPIPKLLAMDDKPEANDDDDEDA